MKDEKEKLLEEVWLRLAELGELLAVCETGLEAEKGGRSRACSVVHIAGELLKGLARRINEQLGAGEGGGDE